MSSANQLLNNSPVVEDAHPPSPTTEQALENLSLVEPMEEDLTPVVPVPSVEPVSPVRMALETLKKLQTKAMAKQDEYNKLVCSAEPDEH
ncbi:hypothetical protein VTP01DRAFT_988 [Rhizomucor pusillus]|uniref:uncharacterized protein n=1 Tax=Rhizomucor pusillus TaxID=4840 RepID=UPI0037429363